MLLIQRNLKNSWTKKQKKSTIPLTISMRSLGRNIFWIKIFWEGMKKWRKKVFIIQTLNIETKAIWKGSTVEQQTNSFQTIRDPNKALIGSIYFQDRQQS